MTESTTTGAPGAWPPGASGPPSTPHADVRAVVEEEAALLGAAGLEVPPLRQLDVRTADRTIVRIALLRFAEQAYEDDTELAARLRLEAENLRAAYLADQADQIDRLQALVREDRKALGKLPTFQELQARRRTYPEPRPMIQAPGWPAPVIPGSGGRRLGEPNEGAA